MNKFHEVWQNYVIPYLTIIIQKVKAFYHYLTLHKNKVLGGCFGIIGIGLLFILLFLSGVFGSSYSDEELINFENETASVVYSEDNILLGKFFAENRTNVSYDQLPKHLVNALVATEDARYFEHEGVDSRSVIRVLIKSILLGDKSSGGGSTITQQLAKNMFGRKDYGPFSMLINKSNEIKIAQQLEELFSKEELLSMYLNTIPFGEDVYGIESASERFFNKKVSDLKIEESAVLIGMLKANTYYNPRLYPKHSLKRRSVVLHQMQKYDYISKSEYDSIVKLPLKLDYANPENQGIANYFLVHVKRNAQKIISEYNKKHNSHLDIESDGLVITTSLNAQLQYYTLQAFQKQLGKMQNLIEKQYKSGTSKKELDSIVAKHLKRLNDSDPKEMREYFTWEGTKTAELSLSDSIRKELTLLHAGFLALNPQDGFIKAWVGGIDFRTHPYDQVTAKRQLASTFKPILYTAALEKGIRPCKYLKNEMPETNDEEAWQPENYSKTNGGMYSMAASLAKSLNIPTVNLYNTVGYSNLKELWEKMEFSYEIKDYPSTALGTSDASLLELARAYSSFANGGYLINPRFITSIKTPDGKVIYESSEAVVSKRVISEESSLLMSAILQKALNNGTGASMRSVYGVRLPLAGKTGTSQSYGDAWFASFNPNLVMVTRVGASSQSIHFNTGRYGTGSTLALPITALTLQKVEKNKELSHELFTYFPALPHYLDGALDCEDYKEGTDVQMFFNNVFKKKTEEEKETKRQERKKRREERKKRRQQN
ncbi:penicillin-binding protein [Flammeovirga pectinis]|uniref:Penicillin-binding protein n=1 Tax=Flammeovirga pectinis TaxID=2494373 RepID=A0A3Q9FM47_9BACT|nr:transglycosylase domain-containing protein [Flammeovirga pectinis]AZQ62859.1 penicillin-binding protein [Flammeovirga pectinis]